MSRPLSPVLPPFWRLFWVAVTLGLGVGPGLLFFAWIERNMALPAPVYQWLEAPWVAFYGANLAMKLLWDFMLFATFGFFHSFLAQKGPQNIFKKILPAQCVRAIYMAFTGLSVLAMIACWQNTGVIVWVLPGLSAAQLSVLSLLIFYGLLFMSGRVVRLFDPLEFVGLKQIYSRPEAVENMSAAGAMIETGIYSRMRHPIYFLTLSAFTLAPMMSLDRLLLVTASVLYLFVGIPIEERKLEARFGEQYRAYRTRVPAVIPRFK